MLVLSRTVGQRILIGKDIELVVNEIRPGRVSLAFNAPESVQILRSEIADRFQPQTEEVTP